MSRRPSSIRTLAVSTSSFSSTWHPKVFQLFSRPCQRRAFCRVLRAITYPTHARRATESILNSLYANGDQRAGNQRSCGHRAQHSADENDGWKSQKLGEKKSARWRAAYLDLLHLQHAFCVRGDRNSAGGVEGARGNHRVSTDAGDGGKRSGP